MIKKTLGPLHPDRGCPAGCSFNLNLKGRMSIKQRKKAKCLLSLSRSAFAFAVCGDIEPLAFGLQLLLRQPGEERLAAPAHLTDFLLDSPRERVEHVFARQRLVDLAHPPADAIQQMVHLAQRQVARGERRAIR